MIKTILSQRESILEFAGIIVVTVVLALIFKKYIEKKLFTKAKEHGIDATSLIFITNLISCIIYFVGFGWALLVLPITHTFAHSLFAGAGVTSLILGFASQQLFTNLISGLYLIIVRPFKVGDTIDFQGNVGRVIAINLNTTIIEDDKNNKTVIPSSLIITNFVRILN